MNNTNTPAKTKKFASPSRLFSRFLQRRAKKPTETQLTNWETDGGNVDVDCNDFTIINGRVCYTWYERLAARIQARQH